MLEKNRHHLIGLEICPIFLVPDTNCFIDHPPSLQKLIQDRHYTIVIPLVGPEWLSFVPQTSDSSVLTAKGNNDDLILNCCTHYCKDKARDYMPIDKDSPVRLYRDVVLLTDDRNLRLKAHTHNVAVKDVPSFIK